MNSLMNDLIQMGLMMGQGHSWATQGCKAELCNALVWGALPGTGRRVWPPSQRRQANRSGGRLAAAASREAPTHRQRVEKVAGLARCRLAGAAVMLEAAG